MACEDDPPPATEAPAAPATEEKPAVDEKIASAMAAAEASARAESRSGGSELAPPPDGILEPELAERELPFGSPAQLVLGAPGSEPRVRLGAALAPGDGPAGKLTVSYRSGGSVMPTIELDVKPKLAAAGAPTAPAAGGEATAGAGSLTVEFALTGARPAESQPGRLPPNAKAEIAKLNGSSLELTLRPNGALLSQRYQLAGDNPDLAPLLTGSIEALTGAVLPYPDVPVGVGAFWMVKSRETANGGNVLAYRMVKVTELSPAQVKLTVQTRRYLLGRLLPGRGLPPHHVRRFESEGEAKLVIRPGSPFPDSVESRDGFMALVTPDDRPNQAIPIQAELSASLTFQH